MNGQMMDTLLGQTSEKLCGAAKVMCDTLKEEGRETSSNLYCDCILDLRSCALTVGIFVDF